MTGIIHDSRPFQENSKGAYFYTFKTGRGRSFRTPGEEQALCGAGSHYRNSLQGQASEEIQEKDMQEMPRLHETGGELHGQARSEGKVRGLAMLGMRKRKTLSVFKKVQ